MDNAELHTAQLLVCVTLDRSKWWSACTLSCEYQTIKETVRKCKCGGRYTDINIVSSQSHTVFQVLSLKHFETVATVSPYLVVMLKRVTWLTCLQWFTCEIRVSFHWSNYLNFIFVPCDDLHTLPICVQFSFFLFASSNVVVQFIIII